MTEGERWAHELLLELHAGRFRPAAWARFLRRSLVRAAERRRSRRRAELQALLLGVGGLSAWAAVGAAGRPGLALAGILWWALVLLMLEWHLGMLERPDGRALRGLGAANVLSLFRAGVVPALPVLSPPLLAAALLAAGTTDVLDGRIARRRDEVSRLGVWLDGAVDGVVLATGAVALARAGLVPPWLAALVVARYGVVWLAAALVYFVRTSAPARDGVVSGRIPGVAVVAGLSLAAVGVAPGILLAAAGAAGGLATFAATAVRTAEPSAASNGR